MLEKINSSQDVKKLNLKEKEILEKGDMVVISGGAKMLESAEDSK